MQSRLLLSYLLIVAVTIAVLAFGMLLLGPPLFDRMLDRHMAADHSMMGREVGQETRQDTESSFREALFQSIVLTTVVASVAVIAVSVFVSRRIADPVVELARVSRRIAHGSYSARADVGDRQTEIGELAASFNEMAAALEDAELRRMRVIGDVSHELRTPLTTLSGYLDGLIDGVIEPDDALWLQLRIETARLEQLAEDLQELSRAEAGVVAVTLSRMPPSQFVENAVEAFMRRFEAEGVALRVEIEAGLPDVIADEQRATQVLTNLLSNALRHTPAGGSVTIAVSTSGDHVDFAVADTGSGIAPEHLPHIFERFYRADPSRARETGGSGIGLTIARALVAAQGGKISARSAGPGHGSVFTFTLPSAP